MDVCIEEFDYIILGTDLAETAISYSLSKKNHKILHLDKNSSYGSEFSTLNLKQLYDHFKKDLIPIFQDDDAGFNIDLTPKLLLRDSKMKDFLLDNEIDEMVMFNSIEASYIFTNTLNYIPISEVGALKSPLIPLLEKYKVMKFFWSVRSFVNNKSMNFKQTMREEFNKFGLSNSTIDLIGHAIALNLNDKYLDEHPSITYKRIVEYISSIASYDDVKSPYIYPIYGLSEICQAFVRKSATNGTLFMLKADIKRIENNIVEVVDPNGDFHRYKAKKIISDTRFFNSSKVEKEIIRCIAIIKAERHESRNIVFLKSHLNRQNDIFCVILNHEECVCPKGYEICILSTIKETEDPSKEIDAALRNFKIVDSFCEVRQVIFNTDTESVIFTKNIDESAVMDGIYEDIMRILNKLDL